LRRLRVIKKSNMRGVPASEGVKGLLKTRMELRRILGHGEKGETRWLRT